MTPYGNRSGSTLAQAMSWLHQDITWTNVDLSSMEFRDGNRKGLSPEVIKNLIRNMN